MGNYLNPDNSKFQRAVNSDIYVDKTGLIKYTNRVINTMQAYVCVSRPRRFGKSMAADMLTAYYSRGCDSRELFAGLQDCIRMWSCLIRKIWQRPCRIFMQKVNAHLFLL